MVGLGTEAEDGRREWGVEGGGSVCGERPVCAWGLQGMWFKEERGVRLADGTVF